MKFYDLDPALEEAIEKGESPVRVQVSVDWNDNGLFEAVFQKDIIEADFFGLKEKAGGTSARADILLANPRGIYCVSTQGLGAGRKVKVSFSLGDGLPYFERYIFYVDDMGFQDIRGPGRKRYLRLGLTDLSSRLRKTDEQKDWKSPVVFTYMAVCDKTMPEKSLVHCMVKRAGLVFSDIDCSTIPLTLPYVKLQKNLWAELSELARTYKAHLECAPEKPLVFAHSVYQSESEDETEISYTFRGGDVFYLRKQARAENYRNSIRLKINLPTALEKQEIWRYGDTPVFYDTYLQPYYPFKFLAPRDIELPGYEALYRVKDGNGKERPVIFADELDTKEEAEGRLEYDGGAFFYSSFDVTSHHDRALLKLEAIDEGDLYQASLYGRPIVLDLNRSCFVNDMEGMVRYGTAALNVSGGYFSGDLVNGKPQYEDWALRELEDRREMKREFTVKTHKALFHARIGARVRISTDEEIMEGDIKSFSLRYRQGAAFEAAFKVAESQGV